MTEDAKLNVVDSPSETGAVIVLLSLVPIQAANMSVMNSSGQIIGQLPYIHDHNSLMLH
jgi:hypothetical protein